MKKYVTLLTATALSSVFAVPFYLANTQAQPDENTSPKLAICEPFPDCIIYRADGADADKLNAEKPKAL
ncbi:hypothetical protein KJI95_06975 [Shewanella sp. JM162201]|uniref:Uncharacterized protein n=1 Tax=Shewanella jiangmenensis TaxID=2837387 RepID=A0ABS5V1B7_9GAMM|nr:hypothetical protein [Shewanella jiangmenensis]MBT1444267.1 hypothetical protein [Shewanella jiangmenensis]